MDELIKELNDLINEKKEMINEFEDEKQSAKKTIDAIDEYVNSNQLDDTTSSHFESLKAKFEVSDNDGLELLKAELVGIEKAYDIVSQYDQEDTDGFDEDVVEQDSEEEGQEGTE